ncbi:MAG: serine/threonine protein kinase, partial [Pyrinomonadaceae bacterium]|nr:serine/threonine protein kinase [Pyrinomonadaceae bacterium]
MDQSSQIIDGRYRVVRQLGQGSFGTTLLAEDTMLSRRVVVKIAHDTGRDSNATVSITREAKAFASFHHPNVARLLDFGALHDGRAYLVVEWVDGTSLRDILAGGPVPLAPALAVLRALAEALGAAHAVGIIHRDLKPSNVIVPRGESGPLYDQAKLIDFGAFGKIRRSTGTTQTGEIYGTVYYMSPEQLLGQAQSTATDVYGLGVLLYEMLTGTTPFTGDSVPKVFSKIIGEAPAIPRSLPVEIRTLLERWLSKDPQARPASAAAALVEIKEVSEVISSSSAAMVNSPPDSDLWDTADMPSPPPAPQAYPFPFPPIPAAPSPSWATTTLSVQVPAPKNSGWSFKNPWVLLGGVAAAAAVMICVLVLWLSGGAPPINANVSATPTPGHSPPGGVLVPRWLGVVFGFVLAGGGVALAVLLRRWLGRRRTDLERDASSIIFGSRSREILTASLALQVDEIVLKVRRLDERILANTLAIMVREFEDAKESQDRQAALMNAAQLMEKLTARLSPWYVQYEKLIAFFVALVGIATGLVSVTTS